MDICRIFNTLFLFQSKLLMEQVILLLQRVTANVQRHKKKMAVFQNLTPKRWMTSEKQKPPNGGKSISKATSYERNRFLDLLGLSKEGGKIVP